MYIGYNRSISDSISFMTPFVLKEFSEYQVKMLKDWILILKIISFFVFGANILIVENGFNFTISHFKG